MHLRAVVIKGNIVRAARQGITVLNGLFLVNSGQAADAINDGDVPFAPPLAFAFVRVRHALVVNAGWH